MKNLNSNLTHYKTEGCTNYTPICSLSKILIRKEKFVAIIKEKDKERYDTLLSFEGFRS
jgi:hypothetical protein